MTPPQTVSNSTIISTTVWVRLGILILLIFYSLQAAYNIRLHAITTFGPVIHEFDPYFNFRATEYLYEHGTTKFFTWFDYKSWYPLGRPVGTTIYPGMQFTAVWIKRFLLGDQMSLNDICVYIPAWFGCIASIFVAGIAYECSLSCNTSSSIFRLCIDLVHGSKPSSSRESSTCVKYPFIGLQSPALEAAVISMLLMAIVPAHLMRSIGGGYDNESVAISSMCLTFYVWLRSLRQDQNMKNTILLGILSGVAYFYMVATWGGYVFVLNMIGLHATLLVLLGRFSNQVYMAYSLFYLVGTYLAIQIPVVGWTPLKSLEQLGPCLVFLGYQVLFLCELYIKRKMMTRIDGFLFRTIVLISSSIIGLFVVMAFAPKGYFGPLSSRVRGLFVAHTRTGNPLVDSVAEHQPADKTAYFRYLQHLCIFAPIGFLYVFLHLGDASLFLIAYAGAAYYFSHRMVRLLLLTAPIASVLAGIAVARMILWSLKEVQSAATSSSKTSFHTDSTIIETVVESKKKKIAKKNEDPVFRAPENPIADLSDQIRMLKVVMAGILLLFLPLFFFSFQGYCWKFSKHISNPSIILMGHMRDGKDVLVDDYREAYWWLRDNTPEDSRILAWWDYGYQISSIANRTTLADGNTWNHEHIALLGKILTTHVDKGYDIARHLADYVLLWTGGGGDDLAKSPHLARIANSVYRDMCPGDPTCRAFGRIDRQGTPSPMMRASFLYSLHSNGLEPGVVADPSKFKEVYKSKYGKVRIYELLGVDQESKRWVADPKNRKCDVPGSWFCRGQYPPSLASVLSKKKDFAQLEDFNRGATKDEDYQRQYFENMNNPEMAKMKALHNHNNDGRLMQTKPKKEDIDATYSRWEDTEYTTLLWNVISRGDIGELQALLEKVPLAAYVRSSDGRGPMWWAMESRKQDIVKFLIAYGLSYEDKDKYGFTPVDLLGTSNTGDVSSSPTFATIKPERDL